VASNTITLTLIYHRCYSNHLYTPGADPGFQVRGGALKKIAPSGGRREIFEVFRVKNHDFTPKNHIFFNFRRGRAPGAPPPCIRPCTRYMFCHNKEIYHYLIRSNPVHGEVHSIQHYVIKFDNDLRHVSGFLLVFRFPPPINLTVTI
jgi:hypothetical protein